MKFCPECGQDLNEQGTCDYCGFPEVKEEEQTNQPIGVFDDSGPKFGLLDDFTFERILESNKGKLFDPKTGKEITNMKDTLEQLGFFDKEENEEK